MGKFRHRFLICTLVLTTNSMLHGLVGAYSDGSLDETINPLGAFPGDPGVESLNPNATIWGAGTTSANANALALQSDGKIVLVGFANPRQFTGNTTMTFAIARLSPIDGSLDSSFTGAGTVFSATPGAETIFTGSFGAGSTNLIAHAVAIQADGNIVVAGEGRVPNASTAPGSNVSLARLSGTNGSLDVSLNQAPSQFPGVPGVESIWTASFEVLANARAGALAVAIQPADQFIVLGCQVEDSVGNNNFAAVRLTTTGGLDQNFNAGHTLPGVRGIVRIPPATFEQTLSTNDNLEDLTLQLDGKIVMVGQAAPTLDGNRTSMAVVRLTTTGGLDPTFNPSHAFPGVLGAETIWSASFQVSPFIGAIANAVTVQSTGEIVLAGQVNSQWAVVRLKSDGSFDTTWNSSGTFVGVPGIAVLPNTSFGVGTTNADPQAVRMQSDGKVVVGGYVQGAGASTTGFAITRFTTTGRLDPTFNASGPVPGVKVIPITTFEANAQARAFDLVIQSDNKIDLAGFADPGENDFAFARLGLFTGGCTTGQATSALARVILQAVCGC